MYKAYKNFSDFNVNFEREWTFENAFFDFGSIILASPKVDDLLKKPLYAVINGTSGNDNLVGTSGDDTFFPGTGMDTIDGGDGYDIISYAGHVGSVHVFISDVNGGVIQGSVDSTFINIEGIMGGDGDDVVYMPSNSVFAGDFYFEGGAGDDRLWVSAVSTLEGDFTFVGGDGDDYMRGARGVDSYDGGTGIDTVSFFNIVVFAGRQQLFVDLRINEVTNDGYGNTETIIGVENITGASVLADTLHGNDFDNKIAGSNGGADNLFGHGGDDFLSIMEAGGTIDGGTGTDTFVFYNRRYVNEDMDADGYYDLIYRTVGASINLLTGQILDDGWGASGTITNIENLIGTEFDDILVGDSNANELSGLGGDDVINGYGGNDIIIGGIGADLLDGGDGNDWVSYSDSETNVSVNLFTGTTSGGTAEGDVLSGFENIVGSEFDLDVLVGDNGDNKFEGRSGSDLIDGGGGTDTAIYTGNISDYSITFQIDGTVIIHDTRADHFPIIIGVAPFDGTDTLTNVEIASFIDGNVQLVAGLLTEISDIYSGTASNDFVDGLGGDDIISGLGGDDRLLGGSGDDTLNGGAGNDTLIGGAGTDVAVYSGVLADYTITANGNGMFTVSPNNAGVDGTDALSGIEFIRFGGVDYVIGITVLTANPDNYTGTSVVDTIAGLAGNDFMSGLAGDDILYGNEGNDNITGGAGNDQLFGGEHNDTLNGQAGDDILDGGIGTDVLFGGLGNDILNGGLGNDRLVGGAGIDTLMGEGGIDRLFGGAGDDIMDGGLGNDVMNGLLDDDTMDGGAGLDRMVGGGGNDIMDGGAGNDFLDGGSGNDAMLGGDGLDRLIGGSGDDTLDAGTGDDILFGGTGADRLVGGAGDDRLNGGADADVFAFDFTGVGADLDTITDFAIGVDTIEIGGGIAYADLDVIDSGVNALIRYDGHRILVRNTTAAQLDASQFTFIAAVELPDADNSATDKLTISQNLTDLDATLISDVLEDFAINQDVMAEFLAQVRSPVVVAYNYFDADDGLEIGSDIVDYYNLS